MRRNDEYAVLEVRVKEASRKEAPGAISTANASETHLREATRIYQLRLDLVARPISNIYRMYTIQRCRGYIQFVYMQFKSIRRVFGKSYIT